MLNVVPRIRSRRNASRSRSTDALEDAPLGAAVARAARCEAAGAGSTDHGGRDEVNSPYARGPARRPTLTIVPWIRVAARRSPKRSPPTWSIRTSAPRPSVAAATAAGRSSVVGSITTSAPTARSAAALAGLVVVATTADAPSARASCTPIIPTPDVAPTTTTRSPGRNPACTRASCSVASATGNPPASVHDRPSGIGTGGGGRPRRTSRTSRASPPSPGRRPRHRRRPRRATRPRRPAPGRRCSRRRAAGRGGL
jgi:hypothetical protein